MNKRALKYACLLAVIAAAAGPLLRAQGNDEGKPEVYTYIAQWAVPRAEWPDMVKMDEQERPLMEKMVADGSILGYGTFANLIHGEDQPTHGSWFTAGSEGKLMKALEQVYALGLTTAPVETHSKHWDLILHSRSYNGRSGHYEGAYLSGSQWQVKPGQGRAFDQLINSTMVPVLEKLVADGSLVSYSVDSEDYHTQKPGVVSLVFTAADANGLDKVNAALDAAFAKDHSIGPAVQALTAADEHRDFLLHVTHMMIK